MSIAHVIIIIKSEIWTLPIVIIFFRGCVPEMFVTSYAVTHCIYRQVSNKRRTFVGNKIVDHSDVVGASPVGAAPTTSSFST